MSCCENCNVDAVGVERDDVSAAIRFDACVTANPALRGKNLRLVNGTLFTANGAMPKGGFRVEMATNGTKHRISVYRQRLPFDELVLLLQFDETEGQVLINQYANVEPLVMLHLDLTKEREEIILYQELAPLVYRVHNRVAMLQLFDHRKLAGRALENATLQLQNNNRRENWPMLVMFDDSLSGMVTRNAPVINIPNWKNNADWQ